MRKKIRNVVNLFVLLTFVVSLIQTPRRNGGSTDEAKFVLVRVISRW